MYSLDPKRDCVLICSMRRSVLHDEVFSHIRSFLDDLSRLRSCPVPGLVLLLPAVCPCSCLYVFCFHVRSHVKYSFLCPQLSTDMDADVDIDNLYASVYG